MKMTTTMAFRVYPRGMALYQCIRSQRCRVTRPPVHGQSVLGGSDTCFHDLCPTPRHAIQRQAQRLLAPMHRHQRMNDTVKHSTLTTRNTLSPQRHPPSLHSTRLLGRTWSSAGWWWMCPRGTPGVRRTAAPCLWSRDRRQQEGRVGPRGVVRRSRLFSAWEWREITHDHTPFPEPHCLTPGRLVRMCRNARGTMRIGVCSKGACPCFTHAGSPSSTICSNRSCVAVYQGGSHGIHHQNRRCSIVWFRVVLRPISCCTVRECGIGCLPTESEPS